jgi:hypothetical protein
MTQNPQQTITCPSQNLSYEVACRLFDDALEPMMATTVMIDLAPADDATTSAFARLVLLRKQLIRQGRDLRLTGLRGRLRGVYEVNRLQEVLPTETSRPVSLN